MSHKVLEIQNSAREKAIKAWLAPAVYDVNYYQNDLANARALRHPRSCEWIFEKEEMGHLLGDTSDMPGNQVHEESFLWIYAKPVCIVQHHCPSRMQSDLRLTKRIFFLPISKPQMYLDRLTPSTQHDANSKSAAGSREDHPIFTLD